MQSWILLLTVILIVTLIFIYLNNKQTKEGFNDESGRFCSTCAGRTFNQCTRCFNCGFCVDKWGNSGCIGGDAKGGYNFEQCAAWYYIDPYSRMMQNNERNQCNNGPISSNRIIGV
jgi:hypothetical protein